MLSIVAVDRLSLCSSPVFEYSEVWLYCSLKLGYITLQYDFFGGGEPLFKAVLALLVWFWDDMCSAS